MGFRGLDWSLSGRVGIKLFLVASNFIFAQYFFVLIKLLEVWHILSSMKCKPCSICQKDNLVGRKISSCPIPLSLSFPFPPVPTPPALPLPVPIYSLLFVPPFSLPFFEVGPWESRGERQWKGPVCFAVCKFQSNCRKWVCRQECRD